MSPSITAVMPIKLNNERLPGKNIKLLGNKPLLRYALEELKGANVCEEIYVFCSASQIKTYLPQGITFLQRSPELDLPTSNFTQIFEAFSKEKPSDIYIYTHATAPFVSANSIKQCVEAVKSGVYDSAFTATKIQDYLWQDGKPLNFNAENLPRSQDLPPIFRESSGVYVFTQEVFNKYHRRIGEHPFVMEISYKEAVDINEPADFRLAETLLDLQM